MMTGDLHLFFYIVNIAVSLVLIPTIWQKKVEKWHYLLICLAFSLGVANAVQLLNERGLLSAIREETLVRIPFYATFLTSVLFCFTAFNFARTNASRSAWIATAFLISTAILLIYEGDLLSAITQIHDEWIAAGWILFTIVPILYAIKSYRATLYPLHRNRFLYWFLDMGIIAVGSFLVFARQQPALGYTVLTIGAVLIVLISLTHQLPDIRQIIKKTIIFLLSASIQIATYTSIFMLMQTITAPFPGPETFILAALITAMSLAFFLNPFINFFQRWISRLVSGRGLDAAGMLGNYSKNIANIIDINHLASAVVSYVASNMRFKYGELFIAESKDDTYILQLINRGSSTSNPTERFHHLDSNSPIINWCLEDKKIITQYDLDFHPKLKSTRIEEKKWISEYKMDIFVPIYLNDEWIGLLAFGPKISRDRIFENEIQSLQALANQTAVALQNARLYEDLKHRNAENESLNLDLSNANQELARLDQAKSDFISIASHEIRTPLTQIIGYNDILTEMVKGGNLPRTAGLQMIEGMQKASHRLEDIVDTMFDVTKLDTQTLELHLSEVQISEVITYAVEKWAIALEDRSQTIIMQGLSALPPIQADIKRLGQTFINLIQNAIKYTPDGGKITISGRKLESPDFIEVTIIDTGIGIDRQDLEKIFDKFYRVGNVMLHSSGETKFKGAGPGLGLTIARGIIEAHNGQIWAESSGSDDDKNPGSTFHVLLPILQK